MPTLTTTARPLVLAHDPDLLDDLLRLAAVSGVEVEVAPDPPAVRPLWLNAPLVVIGADVAERYAAARLPRRSGVVLVGRGETDRTDDHLWQLAASLGAEHVIFLPDADPWLIERYADGGGPTTGGEGRAIGVVGGRGGAGASVLATALAVTAARRRAATMLVDADPLGGGLDLLLGHEGTGGIRWPDLAEVVGRVHPPELQAKLPRLGRLCVLSWDRGDVLAVPPEAVEAALDAGRRGSDLVVVDLPRRLDDGVVLALQLATDVLLVVPAEVRAAAAAARVAAAIGPHTAALRCVVRGPAPGGVRANDIATALALPLAGVLRAEPGLPGELERGVTPAGTGRGPLAELCAQLLDGYEQS